MRIDALARPARPTPRLRRASPVARGWVVLLAVLLAGLAGACALGGLDSPVVENDVAVPMRDGVVLRANVWRPAAGGPFPTLVYRTPYGKDNTEGWYTTHLRAVERGYAVVLQDVRGRYESDGEFFPYVNEGWDGFDTIEWAARQPWSDGSVGTFGLSYPGAVQWLAALEGPPHLEAMVPAMTFSSPRRFFYSNGVWDLSWLAWVHNSIAPDTRRRLGLSGPVTGDEAASEWPLVADRAAELPALGGAARSRAGGAVLHRVAPSSTRGPVVGLCRAARPVRPHHRCGAEHFGLV